MAKKDEPIDDSHAFKERSERFPIDIYLRRFGFKIHARPNGRPAIWTIGDVPYSETEAMKLADEYMDNKDNR